jgi:hypothetical protein
MPLEMTGETKSGAQRVRPLRPTCIGAVGPWIRVPIYLTLWSRVLLEKLTGSQIVKKFPAFYATQRFITAFTRSRHLSLSWARSIQSMPPSHCFKIYLILSSHLRLGLPSGLLPSGFPIKIQHPTKTVTETILSTHESKLILHFLNQLEYTK